MNKAEFLDALRRALSQLPPEELDKQIAYYEELFADMQEDGLSEEEAAAKLGDPAQIARGSPSFATASASLMPSSHMSAMSSS